MISEKPEIIIKSKFSINLNFKEKKELLKLKSTDYKYNFKQQKKWFDKNINSKDLHNLVYYKKTLIGYNCLRNLKILKINSKKINKVKLFDTLVFKPGFSGRGFSGFLLKKNYRQLNKKKTIGLLYCKRNMFNYYKKFNWVSVKKTQILFAEIKKKNLFPMLLNNKKINLKKILINVDTR